MMKKRVSMFLGVLLCAAVVASCSDDDENLRLTGVSGKPSSVVADDADGSRNVYFSYKGSSLSEIKEIKGSIQRFNYENGELVSVYTSPEDKDVADGNGSSTFKKDGNTIVSESCGEPAWDVSFRKEIELGEDNIPVKITDVGIFTNTAEGIEKTEEGKYYGVFTYDGSTKNLARLVVHDKSTSEVVGTYEYEYDNKAGILSNVELPLWYYAWSAYQKRDFRNSYNRIFYNRANNLVKEVVTGTGEDVRQGTYTYSYGYNKDNAPVSMSNGSGNVSITY